MSSCWPVNLAWLSWLSINLLTALEGVVLSPLFCMYDLKHPLLGNAENFGQYSSRFTSLVASANLDIASALGWRRVGNRRLRQDLTVVADSCCEDHCKE